MRTARTMMREEPAIIMLVHELQVQRMIICLPMWTKKKE